MKRLRRLSIRFVHREVNVTVDGSSLDFLNSEPDAANRTPACPTCGSTWVTLVAPTAGYVPVSVDQICLALQKAGLHAQVSAGGLRVCRMSFEEMKAMV